MVQLLQRTLAGLLKHMCVPAMAQASRTPSACHGTAPAVGPEPKCCRRRGASGKLTQASRISTALPWYSSCVEPAPAF